MERVSVEFDDGTRGMFCVDSEGTIIQAGEVIGKATDVRDLSRGGEDEFFTWGGFKIVEKKPFEGACPDY